jgi:hypothetical protein
MLVLPVVFLNCITDKNYFSSFSAAWQIVFVDMA